MGTFGGVIASMGCGFDSAMACGAFGPAASVAINLAVPSVCAFAGLAALRAVARRGLPGPGWGE